jgi:hypothetical protein
MIISPNKLNTFSFTAIIKRSFSAFTRNINCNFYKTTLSLKTRGSKGSLIVTRYMHRLNYKKNFHLMPNLNRNMGYFNADIRKPMAENHSPEDIALFTFINSMNVRKHPFVLELNSKINHKAYSLEEFKNLLKNGEHKVVKIRIIGHLTHSDRPKLLEKTKKIFPFSFTDSDGKERECFMISYKTPINVPPNFDFKINAVRSSFLEKRTKILDIITKERDDILLKPAPTISHTEHET